MSEWGHVIIVIVTDEERPSGDDELHEDLELGGGVVTAFIGPSRSRQVTQDPAPNVPCDEGQRSTAATGICWE